MPRLAIICGHGAGDGGAYGGGYNEADLVRQLGQRIADFGGDEVLLLDTSRNWYADGGVSSLTLDCPIVELHMDCASGSARGGHVIIKDGQAPDEYDQAIADFIGDMFPGRANLIVGRNNLANINRAAARGLNYRLTENGFISNDRDRNYFIDNMDELAQRYCAAFGIGTESEDEMKESDFARIDQIVREVVGNKVDALALAGEPMNNAGLYYQAHVANIGWTEMARDGQIVGSTGKGYAIEALKLLPPKDVSIVVDAHIAGIGWKSYAIPSTGGMVGTTGEGRAIEAIKVNASVPVTYRAHVANIGWQEWKEDGEEAGTTGQALAIEALQILL